MYTLKKFYLLERIYYSGVQIIVRDTGYELQGYDTESLFQKLFSMTGEPKSTHSWTVPIF